MATPVGPRVPKEEFLRALRLDPSNTHHEGYYRAMRDEAIAVYTRLQEDRNNLIEERRNDPAIQPPFFWHHIRQDRRRQAIIDIWQRAAPGSVARQLFDAGETNGEHQPNWVIMWLLYSVFRSRDFRNNRNRRNGNDRGSSGESNGGSDGRYYDPARNGYH